MEAEDSSEKNKKSYTKEYHDPNPWEVSDVTAFLYYCCPECDDRIAFEDAFIQHAILHHERVSKAALLYVNSFIFKRSKYFSQRHFSLMVKYLMIKMVYRFAMGKII